MSGESSAVEFKSRVLTTPSLARRVRGIHDDGGGIVLFGINSDGSILGIPDGILELSKNRLRNLAEQVLPRSSFSIGEVDLDGKVVLFLQLLPPGAAEQVKHVQETVQRDRLRRFWFQLAITLFGASGAALIGLSGWHDLTLSQVFRGLTPHQPAFVQLVGVSAGIAATFGLLFYGSSYKLLPYNVISSILDAIRLLAQARRVDEQIPATSACQEETIKEPTSNELFEILSERTTSFTNKLEQKTNTYLYLGVIIGMSGLGIWVWRLSNLPRAATFTEFVQQVLPRVTILLFVELLAGFFLRQYRIGIEDFKYLFEIEQRIRAKQIAIAILRDESSNVAMQQFAATLGESSLGTVLKKDESTSSLEAQKAEQNLVLDALKVFSEASSKLIDRTKK